MKKTIIFDIDGTLANLDHRLHFVNGDRKNWKEFLARVGDDLPIEQTIFLNNLIRSTLGLTVDIVCCSGRSENERKDTEEWLAKHGVVYDKLYMRPAEDYRADYVIKRELLDQIRTDGREPWIVFDDRQTVVDMWRKEGLFVLQCDPRETFLDTYQFGEHIKYPLTIMVGPSGAGKSTFIGDFVRINEVAMDSVISSDQLRGQICGDFKDQSQNNRVFETMHELAKQRLQLGLPVVLDATHIRRAERVKAASLIPATYPVRYIVIDRPLVDKIKSAGWRSGVSVKGKPLVEYHHEVMRNNLKFILNGDGLPNVKVTDLRIK